MIVRRCGMILTTGNRCKNKFKTNGEEGYCHIHAQIPEVEEVPPPTIEMTPEFFDGNDTDWMETVEEIFHAAEEKKASRGMPNQAYNAPPKETTSLPLKSCYFCKKKCVGLSGLSKHLSECLKDNEDSYARKTWERYNLKWLNTMRYVFRDRFKGVTEESSCTWFKDSTCKGKYIDGGREGAWIFHVLMRHTKEEVLNNLNVEQRKVFKEEFQRQEAYLEESFHLGNKSQGRNYIRRK